MNLVIKARMFAEAAHKEPYDGVLPYIYHLESVLDVLNRYDMFHTLHEAAYLHDVLEDTNRSYNDIKRHFGLYIAEIVYAVTTELGRNRKERNIKTYPKIKGNLQATALKLADRIANMEYSLMYGSPNMYNMYVKEMQEFQDGIRDLSIEDAFIRAMWNRLWDLTSQKPESDKGKV